MLGAGLLMEGDLEVEVGQSLDLSYAFFVLDDDPGKAHFDALYAEFSA